MGCIVGRRRVSLLGIFEFLLVTFWLGFGAWTVWGQAGTDPAPETKEEPAVVGQYSLVTTVVEASGETHWLSPAPTVSVQGGTRYAAAETAGNLAIPPQYAIAEFGVPRYECSETAAKQQGCSALDRTDVVIRDANTVGYRIETHGPAVQLTVNLKVHDRLPVSQPGPTQDWHAGEIIFVPVPKATAAYAFVSEALVGTWQDEPIVFEPGKPLPASAKKGLEDLGTKQDLGDRVLYAFRVKPPEAKK